jgi:ribosomal subunit interface protein
VDITLSARHIDISPALRAAAEEKFGRLSRFGSRFDRVEVHFVEERNPRIAAKEVCEVTVEGQGVVVRAKAAAADAFGAIDAAVEKLEHQLHSVKDRLVRPRR